MSDVHESNRGDRSRSRVLIEKLKSFGVHITRDDETNLTHLCQGGNDGLNTFFDNIICNVTKDRNTLTETEEALYNKAVTAGFTSYKREEPHPGLSSSKRRLSSDYRKEIECAEKQVTILDERLKEKRELKEINQNIIRYQEGRIEELKASCTVAETNRDEYKKRHKGAVRGLEREKLKVFDEVNTIREAKKRDGSNLFCFREEDVGKLKISIDVIESEAKRNYSKWQITTNRRGMEVQSFMNEMRMLQERLYSIIKERIVLKCHYEQLKAYHNTSNRLQLPSEEYLDNIKIASAKVRIDLTSTKLESMIRRYAKSIIDKRQEQFFVKHLNEERQRTNELNEKVMAYVRFASYLLIIEMVARKRDRRLKELIDCFVCLEEFVRVTLRRIEVEKEMMESKNVVYESCRKNQSDESVLSKRIDTIVKGYEDVTAFDRHYETAKSNFVRKSTETFAEVHDNLLGYADRLSHRVYGDCIRTIAIAPRDIQMAIKVIPDEMDANRDQLLEAKNAFNKDYQSMSQDNYLKVMKLFWLYYLTDRDYLMRVLGDLEKEIANREMERLMNLKRFLAIE